MHLVTMRSLRLTSLWSWCCDVQIILISDGSTREKPMRFLKLIAILLLVGCTSLPEASPFEEQVDNLFTDTDAISDPGYAIGIIREGELVFAKGYGVAGIAKANPITTKTAFNIASLSKQFTAASLAKEIESGRISLEDKLSDHWPDLPLSSCGISLLPI